MGLASCSDDNENTPEKIDNGPANEQWSATFDGADETVPQYPDLYSHYWQYVWSTKDNPNMVLKIHGAFPHCSYFSFSLYDDADGSVINGSSDYAIKPDAGSVNPFVETSTKENYYTVYIVPEKVSDEKLAKLGANSNIIKVKSTVEQANIMIRQYLSVDQNGTPDIYGGVDMPSIQAYDITTMQEVKAPKTLEGNVNTNVPAFVNRPEIDDRTDVPFLLYPSTGFYPNSATNYLYARTKVADDQVLTLTFIPIPSPYIKNRYNSAINPKQRELLVYMDFVDEELNSQGTIIPVFSAVNKVIEESEEEPAGDVMFDISTVEADNKVTAPVRSSAGLQKLPFTWNSTGNELQININKANSVINNQHIILAVRRVEDLHGNPMKNAQLWSTYVNRNVLTWENRNMSFTIPYKSDTTIVARFTNKSGLKVAYNIECESQFVELGHNMGSVNPLGEDAVEIHIVEGLAPGVYATTINLIDENSLCSRLTISFEVNTTQPNWIPVTGKEYSSSMSIAGVVKKNQNGKWLIDMNKRDIVGAFIGNDCVGKAEMKVDAINNTSNIFLNLRYKKDTEESPKVEFRLWDAKTGEISLLNPGNTTNGVWTDAPITFQPNAIVGADQPVEMRTSKMKIQRISLHEGWNWVSFNVKPHATTGINGLFSKLDGFSKDDILKVPFKSYSFATYQGDGEWDKCMDTLLITKDNVYMIYVQNAATAEVTGDELDASQRTATLTFAGSQWAPLAYLSDKALPIHQALRDFVAGSAKAPAGTVVKSYDNFAIAKADGSWFGSLTYLAPGEGYFVRKTAEQSAAPVTISFPVGDSEVLSTNANAPRRVARGESATSMPVIAALEADWQKGDELLAISGSEIVASDEATTDNLFLLSLHAEEGAEVKFAKVRNGEVVAVTRSGIRYNGQGMAGSLERPYMISFEAGDSDELTYDLNGRRFNSAKDILGSKVYIVGNKKVLK